MSYLVIAILTVALSTHVAGQLCNQLFGPPGSTECLRIEGYIGYQWATCLSDRYIQLKSKGLHICDPKYAPVYCWYQCQIETFNKESGLVYKECQCNIGDPLPSHPDEDDKSTLPDSCFSPSGTDCDWYRNCLERTYPCSATENGYALSFAEKFCNLFTERRLYFSSEGAKWVNAVRKCLQVALVPQIRPYVDSTCLKLKQIAFDSHTPCYLEPFPDAPSICDLGCKDWAQIFWTIKSGFSQAFVESLKGVVGVMLGCGKKFQLLDDNCPTVIVKLTLVASRLPRGRRSTDEELTLDKLAGGVADQISRRLKWNKDVMDWYSYFNNSADSESDEVHINILLGDKIKLKLVRTDVKFDLGKTVTGLADALKDGKLYNIITNGRNVSVASLSACDDIQCDETFLNATAGPPCLHCYNHASHCHNHSYITTTLLSFMVVWVGLTGTI